MSKRRPPTFHGGPESLTKASSRSARRRTLRTPLQNMNPLHLHGPVRVLVQNGIPLANKTLSPARAAESLVTARTASGPQGTAQLGLTVNRSRDQRPVNNGPVHPPDPVDPVAQAVQAGHAQTRVLAMQLETVRSVSAKLFPRKQSQQRR